MQVRQLDTRINVCISSDIDGVMPQMFQPLAQDVSVEILSRLHRFGADHRFSIGNVTSGYRTRAFFALGDRRERIMAAESQVENEAAMVEVVHRLVVAYVFSAYERESRDKDVTDELLNGLRLNFTELDPSGVFVLPGLAARETARTYKTSVEGAFPMGPAVFHAARNVFGGAAALVVTEGDTRDFFVEQGMEMEAKAVVWGEITRVLNWLSVCVILFFTAMALALLRKYLKPANTADIAALFVKREVGAELWRSPVEVAHEEQQYFRLWRDEGDDDYEEMSEVWRRLQKTSLSKYRNYYEEAMFDQRNWRRHELGANTRGRSEVIALHYEDDCSLDCDSFSEVPASSRLQSFSFSRLLSKVKGNGAAV